MARADGRKPRYPVLRHGAAALLVVLALPGCQLGLPFATGGTAGGTAAVAGASGSPAAGGRAAGRTVERDVERPEVFELQEAGLWDGRPSLGGIWVAHPEATDPERVVIRHSGTGASVTGALFRREREQPGPRFQVSSEAANALGILPGAPTTIRVTALRLEQVEVAPAAPPASAAGATSIEPEAPRGLRSFFQRLRPAADPAPVARTDPTTDPDTIPATIPATGPVPLAQTAPPRRRP